MFSNFQLPVWYTSKRSVHCGAHNEDLYNYGTVICLGESKMICTLGICLAVGYTAGWAWHNTHGLLLSYHFIAGVTLIVHFCHEFFFALTWTLPISFAPKKSRGQWSLFVGWRCTRCRNDVSAVWEQCHVATDCLLMEREVQKWSHKR